MADWALRRSVRYAFVHMEEEQWVEVRRFTDAVSAEMHRDFLADHDVRVGLHGNPQATRMTWSASSEVYRIVVLREDLDRATEALRAMTAREQHPFRGPTPAPNEDLEPAAAFRPPKHALFGTALAVLVPLGAGHFFTQHTAAAKVLALGMIGSFLLAFVGGQPQLFRVWGMLVFLDAVGAFFATRRYNRQAIPSDRQQAIGAFFAVIGVYLVAAVLPYSR